jgi:hypothetical protein
MPKWKRREIWILIEVASNDKNWVSYDTATWGDHNAKGFMILARSVCETMAKKSKLGHFSTPRPPISQEKKLYGADFLFCQVTWPRATSSQKQRVNSPHSYKTWLLNKQTDGPTDRWTDALLNSYLTSSADKIFEIDLENPGLLRNDPPFHVSKSWWRHWVCCG